MIRNNLSILLAERQLRITKLANDTEISRSTITSIAQNDTKMIQLDVINKICTHLSIEPKDFFSFIPIDITSNFNVNKFGVQEHKQKFDDLKIPDLNDFSLDLFLTTIDNTHETFKYTYNLNVNSLSIERDTDLFDEISIPIIELDIFFKKTNTQEMEYASEKHFSENIWNKMDTPFKVLFIRELKQNVLKVIAKEIKNIYLKDYPDNPSKKIIAKNLEKRFLSSRISINKGFFDI